VITIADRDAWHGPQCGLNPDRSGRLHRQRERQPACRPERREG
jgi:hypothetical protein